MKTNDSTKTLSQLIDEQYGKKGVQSRTDFDNGFQAFKLGQMIQDARIEKGLTQQQLAEKCGTTKSYISRLENNVKEVRLSTLQRIVELGLGGHLNLSINL